ncbi:MAG: hypothetical protein ACR2IP_10100 [Solirubrobacteraceae bacterium]
MMTTVTSALKRRSAVAVAVASGSAIGLLVAGAALADSMSYNGVTSQHSRINVTSINGRLGLAVAFHKRCRDPAGKVAADITGTYRLPANSNVRVGPSGDFAFTRRDRHQGSGSSALSLEPYYVIDTLRIRGHLGPSSASGTFRLVQTFHQAAGEALLDRCTSGGVRFQAKLY